jgi:hypothetical protein
MWKTFEAVWLTHNYSHAMQCRKKELVSLFFILAYLNSNPATLLLVLLLLHISVLAELEDSMLVSQCYRFSNALFLAFSTHCR